MAHAELVAAAAAAAAVSAGMAAGMAATPVPRPPLPGGGLAFLAPEHGATPLDVVGLGHVGRDEDPTQRGLAETPEEYARRRDPETMEAIRQALR